MNLLTGRTSRNEGVLAAVLYMNRLVNVAVAIFSL